MRGAGTVAAARGEREKEPELVGCPHARKSKSEIFSPMNKPANNWSSSGLTSPGAVENPESMLCVLPSSEVGESSGESPQLLALVEISHVPVTCSSGTTDTPPSSSARRASRARLQSQSAREEYIPVGERAIPGGKVTATCSSLCYQTWPRRNALPRGDGERLGRLPAKEREAQIQDKELQRPK